jgi:hypothetical protein
MKTTKFIILFATVLLIGIGTTKAQNPTFTVNWSGCNIQVSGSYFQLTYTIWDISTQSPAFDPVVITGIDQTVSSYQVFVTNWDCNQSLETKNYLIIVQVALIKDANYCAGDVRSNTLTCAELYDNITLNVPMDY